MLRRPVLRRQVLRSLGGVAGATMAYGAGARIARAAAPGELSVALLAPLSGSWAQQGRLMQLGAEMAVADINAKGGVHALGGAKIRLVSADAGDTTETAVSAAQRLLSQNPDLAGGTGAWLSSFTIALTEVTEHAKLPWLTESAADAITGRGFKYVFQTTYPGSLQGAVIVPALISLGEAAGAKPKTVGVITDNTASPMAFAKPLRAGGLAKMGLKVVLDETYTPPLADATPLVERVRHARPDFLFFVPTALSDDKLFFEKMKEFHLGGGRIPVVSQGSSMTDPELPKIIEPSLLEGVMVIVMDWPGKDLLPLAERFDKQTGQPWMGQDSLVTYGDMWVLKEAAEMAKSADREKIADAIRSMNITGGIARYYAGNHLQFDAAGRRTGAGIKVVQWQKGTPVLVYPTENAVAKPIWPKH
jgi:branched-chain amino acid transport system substrate-binding protein